MNTVENKLVLKAVEATSGGILIPAGSSQVETMLVECVGPGVYHNGVLVPVSVPVGAKVTFRAGTGLPVTINGTTYTILRESDVLTFEVA